MNPTQSAVIVAIEEAGAAVGGWRRELDVWARRGVPAHVTVLTPFVPPAEIDDAVLDAVRSAIATVPAFDVVFRRTAWFGSDVLWLDPEPSEPFRELTAQVWQRFPQCVPYEGAHDELVPHLTVGWDSPAAELLRAEHAVSEALPIHGRVTHARLICGSLEDDSWRTLTELALGKGT